MKIHLGLLTLTAMMIVCAGRLSLGQEWATAMFDHTSHDFGMVARGAKVEHVFTLKNLYVEDVHIAGVRTSCGCTQPRLTKDTLKTYETAQIIATVDTRAFLGRKDATITVTFDKPFPAEVQLHTYVYIRSDVVFEPGEVLFSGVPAGTTAARKVQLSYAGRNDWQIVQAVPSVPFLDVKLVETARGGGQVRYEITVTLQADAPPGYFSERIDLITNDLRRDAQRVSLPVEGSVVAAVTVQPSQLLLGVVKPGNTPARNIVIQAREPFRVLQVTGPDARFRFVVPTEKKSVTVIPVTFEATNETGEIRGEIIVRTDLPGYETIRVPVLGKVE
ncbi:MAG: DUF1573 domain-containing protein [Thermogutta sp.]|nr:DUF1573 domain-containing protein [Thermogutta sp.]